MSQVLETMGRDKKVDDGSCFCACWVVDRCVCACVWCVCLYFSCLFCMFFFCWRPPLKAGLSFVSRVFATRQTEQIFLVLSCVSATTVEAPTGWWTLGPKGAPIFLSARSPEHTLWFWWEECLLDEQCVRERELVWKYKHMNDWWMNGFVIHCRRGAYLGRIFLLGFARVLLPLLGGKSVCLFIRSSQS